MPRLVAADHVPESDSKLLVVGLGAGRERDLVVASAADIVTHGQRDVRRERHVKLIAARDLQVWHNLELVSGRLTVD